MPKNDNAIVCPSCGANNASVTASGRCIACGARMDSLRPAQSSDFERQRRYQQEGFSILWCLIALVLQSVLTAALIGGLPMLVQQLDFEGSNGMIVAIPVWFLGGTLLGMISPGKTFLEPVVASLLVAIPTVFYLLQSQTVRTMPLFMYVIMALIGVLFTLIGAYLGERIQLGPPPKAAD
ncbi:hypothetical protein WMF31_39370 [Sorangium sp. So ce1036]|uniref:hypothetical protein n=1 Tax=Sorangium sp. So ce1036 TaxID=3133328 RepID=UPI003F01D7CF